MNFGHFIFKSNIVFSNSAQAIAIYESTTSLVGKNVEASGWGTTETASTPNQLYAVQMPVVTKANSQYSNSNTYNDALMLIAGLNGGKINQASFHLFDTFLSS